MIKRCEFVSPPEKLYFSRFFVIPFDLNRHFIINASCIMVLGGVIIG